MKQKPIRCTQAGYDALQQKYESYKKQRPEAVEHLKRAREMGDLSENGYYKASRAKLSFIDSQLMKLKYQLKMATIVSNSSNKSVMIGSTVIISDGAKEVKYHIVGDLEANPAEGKISLLSPLGKALYKKHEGDTFVMHLPRGAVTYTVVTVSS